MYRFEDREFFFLVFRGSPAACESCAENATSRSLGPICIATEKARKPASSRLSGLSDLHARQVHTAESVYYVFNSRVLHTRHSDFTDFHNTTPWRARLGPTGFFSTRKERRSLVYRCIEMYIDLGLRNALTIWETRLRRNGNVTLVFVASGG